MFLKDLFVCLFMKNVETAARETLEKVMADVLLKSGSTRSSVQAVCLAVSGVNHPSDQYRILGWLRFLFLFLFYLASFVYVFPSLL